jgi:hypothetical protein
MSRLNVGDPAVRDAAPRILSQVGLECVDNLRVATPEEAAGLDAAVAGMVGGASQSSPKQPSSA